MKIGKQLMTLTAIVSIALLNSGCFVTMNNVKKYNAKVQERAFIMEVVGDNEEAQARLGIDVLQAKDLTTGYFAAWKNEPVSMLTSAGLDTLWMGLTAVGVKEIYDEIEDDDNGSSSASADTDIDTETGTTSETTPSNGRDGTTLSVDGITVDVGGDGNDTFIYVGSDGQE